MLFVTKIWTCTKISPTELNCNLHRYLFIVSVVLVVRRYHILCLFRLHQLLKLHLTRPINRARSLLYSLIAAGAVSIAGTIRDAPVRHVTISVRKQADRLEHR